MISFESNRPRQKAVPQTQSVIVRMLLSTVIGLAVLVAGILRIRDIGAVTLAGMAMPLVGMFLLVVAIWVARDLPAARELDANGVITQGKIVSKWTQTDSDQDRQCYVAYKFGEECEAIQKVSWKHYQQVEVREEVEVRYLPEDPSRSRLEGEWHR